MRIICGGIRYVSPLYSLTLKNKNKKLKKFVNSPKINIMAEGGVNDCNKNEWDESQLRKYKFKTKQLPRLSCQDDRAKELIKAGVGVVCVMCNGLLIRSRT